MYYLSAILFIPSLLLGFTVASCLATRVSENLWWMLAVGLACSLLIPAVLASWLRSLRRGQAAHDLKENTEGKQETPELPRSPTTLGTVVFANLLMLTVASVAAPGMTREAVGKHGKWWAAQTAQLAGKDADHQLVQRTDAMLQWLVQKLPTEAPLPKISISPDRPGDGGVARTPVDAATGPVLDGDPAPPGEVRVVYRKKGSAIVVPVVLSGPDGDARVKMIFDTGATITTVDRATLHRLGLAVGSADPVVQSHTAAGTVRRHLTVIEGASLNGAAVDRGLAVAVCDPCAQGDVVGLLGLNFSRHFLVTVDHDGGAIVLKSRPRPIGRVHDIRHFVELKHAKGLWRGPLLRVSMVVHNRSARSLRKVRVAAEVGSGAKKGLIEKTIEEVPARGQVSVSMSGFPKVRGTKFLVKLLSSEW